VQPTPAPTEPSADELASLLPARFNDGRVVAAVFTIPFERAREAVTPPQLHPVEVPGKKAFAVICTFEYVDSSLGPYREFAVGVVARRGQSSGPLSTLDLFSTRPDTGAWIVAMPVTSEKARRYGVDLFGFPKTLMSVSVQRTSGSCSTAVLDDERPIVTTHVPLEFGPKIPVPWLVTYTSKSGQLLRTRIRTKWWATLSSGAKARVEITDSSHPLAQSLLQLGLPKSPLIVLHGERFRAILPAGEQV